MLETTGSPVAATATRSFLELLPSAIGVRKPKVSLSQRKQDVADVNQQADLANVDISANQIKQREQIRDSAVDITQGQKSKGEGIQVVQDAIVEAKKLAREDVKKLYDIAGQAGGEVSTANINVLVDSSRQVLDKFDPEIAPQAHKRFKELEKIESLPHGSSIKLDAFEKWRQKINAAVSKRRDTPADAALIALKAQADSWLDAQFNADMVSGNPAAIQKWKDARSASATYRRNFKDNRVIRQLAEQEATPEQISSWIIGTSAAGAKREAGLVIQKIKAITGEDGAPITAIRQEVMFDIMEPLLRDEPNMGQFVRNYESFVRKSPTVAKELFPDALNEMTALYRVSKGNLRLDPRQKIKIIEPERVVSVFTVGHNLARKAALVSGGTTLLQALRSSVGKSEKRRVLAAMLGYNPDAPILPITPVLVGGAVQTGIDESN